MTDITPPLEPTPHYRRHWLEYVATGAALFISAVSLWVAIGTMDANNKMVAAASWPFLQIDTSDGTPDGAEVMRFDVTNAGVGPAIVQTFESEYDGTPLRSSADLLARCCGFDSKKPRPVVVNQPQIGSWTTGTIAQSVIRAGETREFFRLMKTDKNDRTYQILKKAVAERRLLARACWCSVFNECWQGSFIGLKAERVDKCAVPAVSYSQ
jgi:hypothetical protein